MTRISTLTFLALALALAGCGAGAEEEDCLEATDCCEDADEDGVCDEEGCAEGTVDDGAGGCCDDPDSDGICGLTCEEGTIPNPEGAECCDDLDADDACDPDPCPEGSTFDWVYGECCDDADGDDRCDEPSGYIGPTYMIAYAAFAVDPNHDHDNNSNTPGVHLARDHFGSMNGSPTFINASTYYQLYDSEFEQICSFTILHVNQVLVETEVGGEETPIGFVLDTSNSDVVVEDGEALNELSCFYADGSPKLAPEVWGENFPESIETAGLRHGFAVLGALPDGVISDYLAGQIATYETDWAPYALSATPIFNGEVLLRASAKDPTRVPIGFGRAYSVSAAYDAGNLSAPSFVGPGTALAGRVGFGVQTVAFRFNYSHASMLVGDLSE
jgi:hypothetical protein